MRILHITEAAEYGVLRHISLVTGELARRGHECAVLLFGNRIDEGVELPCQRIIHRQTGGRLANLLDSIKTIRRTITDFQPDIVHLHAFTAGVAGRLAAKGCIHSPHSFALHKSIPWLTRKAVAWTEKLLCLRTGAYAFVSENEYLDATQLNLDQIKLHVCLNGLPDDFANGMYSRKEARSRLEAIHPGMFNAKKTGVFPGRLCPQKNPGLVVDALEKMGNDAPRIVFCGDGPLMESLKQRNCPSAFFAGKVPELWRYLKAFDFAIMTSWYEGLSYAFLECMAAGIPIAMPDEVGITDAFYSRNMDTPNNLLQIWPNDGADDLAKTIRGISEMSSYPPCIPLTLAKQVDALLEVYNSCDRAHSP
ncbi:MAG: glycosyltransferase family 4 protein [Victivallales bacterium]|nr:glycosyltransferase family 4 protein [Victivallales bacterium]